MDLTCFRIYYARKPVFPLGVPPAQVIRAKNYNDSKFRLCHNLIFRDLKKITRRVDRTVFRKLICLEGRIFDRKCWVIAAASRYDRRRIFSGFLFEANHDLFQLARSFHVIGREESIIFNIERRRQRITQVSSGPRTTDIRGK